MDQLLLEEFELLFSAGCCQTHATLSKFLGRYPDVVNEHIFFYRTAQNVKHLETNGVNWNDLLPRCF